MKDCMYTVLSVFLAMGVMCSAANDAGPARVRASVIQDRVEVVVDGRLFTSYKFGHDQKYPYFWPVNGPASDKSVTTETSMPYPHHHSLFFGCDRVNGGNYWQEGNERGQILSAGPEVLVDSGDYVLIRDRCVWKRPGFAPVFDDLRCFLIHAPDKDLRVIDLSVHLKAVTDVTILRTNHALFAARMAPELSVTGGGILINAEGKTGENGTFGLASPWCDYSGTRDGVTEGLAIFQSPANPWFPCRWFTRDYGFFSPTPMYWLDESGLKIAEGQTLTFSYRVLVHSGDSNSLDAAGLYANYAGVSSKTDSGVSVCDVARKEAVTGQRLLRFLLESARGMPQ